MTTVFKKLDEQIIELADTIAREMRKVLELAKTKADKTDITTALETKADKSTVVTKAELQEVSSNVLLKVDKSYVDTQLASKVDKLYVDNAIAGKADTTSVNTELAKKANATDVSTALLELVPKIGDRGTLAGHNVPAVWSGSGQTMTITAESDDSNYTANCGITVPNNSSDCTWIKTVYMTEAVPVTLGDSWSWADAEAPTLTKGLLVFYACKSYGIATFIPAEAT